jgi:type I restriction enzyme S subunit
VKRIAASHKSPSKNQSEPIDPPFEIPDSWEWVRLKELGVFCGGHTPSTSNPKLWGGDILWVSSKDMKSKYIDDTQIKVTRLGAEELNVLKPGALLMCTRSGILRRVFPVAIARRELTINQDQRALTLWLPEMIEYVYLALKSLESIILSDYKKSGTTVESIIWNKFVDLPIPLPPLNEQKRIVKRVEALKATTRTLVTF